MKCDTHSHYDENGEEMRKNKLAYETFKEANEKAKILNLARGRKKMLSAYKCKICGKYHIGKNGKYITEEYRKRVTPTIKLKGLTVTGKIDLTPLKKNK